MRFKFGCEVIKCSTFPASLKPNDGGNCFLGTCVPVNCLLYISLFAFSSVCLSVCCASLLVYPSACLLACFSVCLFVCQFFGRNGTSGFVFVILYLHLRGTSTTTKYSNIFLELFKNTTSDGTRNMKPAPTSVMGTGKAQPSFYIYIFFH